MTITFVIVFAVISTFWDGILPGMIIVRPSQDQEVR